MFAKLKNALFGRQLSPEEEAAERDRRIRAKAYSLGASVPVKSGSGGKISIQEIHHDGNDEVRADADSGR